MRPLSSAEGCFRVYLFICSQQIFHLLAFVLLTTSLATHFSLHKSMPSAAAEPTTVPATKASATVTVVAVAAVVAAAAAVVVRVLAIQGIAIKNIFGFLLCFC